MFKIASRRFFFWGMVVLYIIAATLLLLYAEGYRVHLRPFFVSRTGNILGRYTPENARFLLDGVVVSESSPARIRTVFPGTHTVRIEKNDFLTFEKTISVEPQKTSFVTDIVLFPDAPATTTDMNPSLFIQSELKKKAPVFDRSQFSEQINQLLDSPNNLYLMHSLQRKETVLIFSIFEVWRLDISTKTIELLTRVSQPIQNALAISDTDAIILVFENSAVAINMSDANPRVETTLVKNMQIEKSALSESGDALLFTARDKDALSVYSRRLR